MEAIAWIALSVLSFFIAKAVYRQQCSRLLAFTSGLLLFFGVSFLAWAFNIAPPFTLFVCVISGILLFVFGFFSLLDMSVIDGKMRCSIKEYKKDKKKYLIAAINYSILVAGIKSLPTPDRSCHLHKLWVDDWRL